MSQIARKLTSLIGHTPLLELSDYNKSQDLQAVLIAKVESFNPLFSVKDRVAFAMVQNAEEKGLLKPGGEIIEPTSGNTGIGLAFVAASRSYKLTLTMPETMSVERRQLLKALGANLVLTPGTEGMKGSIAKAEELKTKNPNAIILQQFENPANPEIHRKTTAPEILQATQGNLDYFVSAVGTGGTITGTGEVLKQEIPSVKIIAVEPDASPVLSGGKPGPHKIQGIGAGFIPKIYNPEIVDEIIRVKDEDAFQTCRELVKTEGLLVGISSGAAVFAATQLAKRKENKGKRIVVILPDTGERYLSTGLFEHF